MTERDLRDLLLLNTVLYFYLPLPPYRAPPKTPPATSFTEGAAHGTSFQPRSYSLLFFIPAGRSAILRIEWDSTDNMNVAQRISHITDI